MSPKPRDVLMVPKNSKPGVICCRSARAAPHTHTDSHTHSPVGQGEGANICQDPWHQECQQGHMHSEGPGAACQPVGRGWFRVKPFRLRGVDTGKIQYIERGQCSAVCNYTL